MATLPVPVRQEEPAGAARVELPDGRPFHERPPAKRPTGGLELRPWQRSGQPVSDSDVVRLAA
ncbi:hypothetical protein [Streptomyces qinglanensis]|uniref:hypothetical protein n=1 Tax=Streptomyces qinglanensis TaxID=943816 RepID=UPI003D75FB62